ASGPAYAGATAGGLHFLDAGSGPGLRFSHATWIGADGRRREVEARWDGERIAMTVPARTVEETAYPAVLDPVIGPEVAVDNPVVGPASGTQAQTTVA